MSKTIQDYFDNAQLSQASYAILNKNFNMKQYTDALRVDNNFSQSQATEFAQKYSIVHSQQNTATGFSATVFKDTAGGYTFAIRGTELPGDVINDVVLVDLGDIGGDGIALKQAVDLFNYYQLLTTDTNSQAMQLEFYEGTQQPDVGIPFQVIQMGSNNLPPTYRYLNVVDSVAGLGKIPPTAEINVTGHSLGGHLALILARLDPAHINQVYTYNAPGFDTFIGSNDTDWFFNTIHQLQQQEQGSSSVSVSGFPNEKIHNLVIPKDVISDIGTLPNGRIEQFGEAQDIVTAHFIAGMVDPLALYRLLSDISPDLDFEQITPLLQLGANQPEADLEGTLNAVGNILLLSSVPKVEIGNREEFYKRLQAISTEIYLDANALTPVLKPQYQNLQLVDVGSLADASHLNNADGFAYRYALKNLNPFAITGNVNLYSQHNNAGELNIDKFTDQYLQDRARFLALKNEAFSNDGTIPISDVIEDGEKTLYRDLSSDILKHIIKEQGPYTGGTNPPQRVTLGTDSAESGVPINGGIKNDRLYGGGGNDTIKGSLGNDYIEGSAGDDVLYGDAGSDTLIGGAGGDNLHGGSGNDTLKGGQGNDHLYAGKGTDTLIGGSGGDSYYFNTGDGLNFIKDTGTGDKLVINGQTLGTSSGITAIAGHQGVYTDDNLNRYTLSDNGLLVIDIAGGNNGQDRIIIENFNQNDFGLNLIHGNDNGNGLSFAGNLYLRKTNQNIKGGKGRDMIFGNDTTSQTYYTLEGGKGSDLIYGGRGKKYIYGGQGRDLITGIDGGGIAFGGDGDDNLTKFIKTLLQISSKLNYTQVTNRDTAHYLTRI